MAVSYARNGAITITTAGTRVQGPDVPGAIFHLKANAAATGILYVGDSAVAAANGYPMKATEAGIEMHVANLSQLWFDGSVNGEKIMWLRKA